jgi:hypothetical protein
VDDEVDFVIEESLLELAHEQAFAAQFVQGAVGDLVAGSFESGDIDAQGWVKALERIYDELRLGQGESGAAGAEAQSCRSLT